MTKRVIFLSLVTLIGLPALGLLIIYLVEGDFVWREILIEGNYIVQFLLGTLHALVSLFFIILLYNSNIFKGQKVAYIKFIKGLKLSIPGIIFISICAGFGEELLFRFAIQRYIGIWVTAIIFVALHGYLRPKKHVINIYGILIVLVTAGLGYLYKYVGIWSAIWSHTLIDIILLTYGTKNLDY